MSKVFDRTAVALGSADVPPASIKPLRAELGNFERPPVS